LLFVDITNLSDAMMTLTDLQESLLTRLAEAIETRRCLPGGTYRLQLNAGFTFRDALALVDYLHELGITHCYASPFLQARPGSTHGYDIINHQVLNPEIGSPQEFEAWVSALHERGMGLILDMVPNHMGVMTDQNPWWNDVLENGPGSPYAGYFDIAWHASPRPQLQDRVLVPILGEPYGKVLESGQLRLEYEAGAFRVCYFEHRFPLAPRTYALILRHRLQELEQVLGSEALPFLEYQSIITAAEHLPPRTERDPAKLAERQREKEIIKRRLATLADDSPPVRDHLAENVRQFNGQPGDRHSFDLLDALLDEQPYRLAYWRVAADEINYRRFFDINDLAALSMERPEVFEATHALVLRLLAEGKLDGLRIDHIDGLYDPKQYLERLQERYVLELARGLFEADPARNGLSWDEVAGPLAAQLREARQSDNSLTRPLYVVVEKILSLDEPLQKDWPIYGTSGYNFLNRVNGLFVARQNDREFSRLYRAFTGEERPFPDIVYQCKLLILQVALSSELHMLARQLDDLAQKDRWSRDFTLNTLRHSLREVIACFPVYRSYISAEGIHDTDRRYVETAVRRAMMKNPSISRSVFFFIRNMLLQQYPDTATETDKAEQLRFAGKFQQVTAPVMAKGLEDTAFYVYNRLVTLNEVGGDPGQFGQAPETLHRYFAERQAKYPWALSALSTHDTKRGEDVRARLNVLSELPRDWEDCLARWGRLNAPHRQKVDDLIAPDPNEEYLLYQTLLGAWPLTPLGPDEKAQLVQRLQDYMTKALHEAKVHSSWINPNTDYDEAVRQFVARILDEEQSREFLDDFRTFQARISHYGLFNSLSQTVLRLTAPGVPDTYQGTELWDFNLVDPDNRRPVDYGQRRRLLAELRAGLIAAGRDRRTLCRELVQTRTDGRIKLFVTAELLGQRRQNSLFASGDYLPLGPTGQACEHVFAFLRRQGESWALVAVPRLLTKLVPSVETLPLGRSVWGDTALPLPEAARGLSWENLFTGEALPNDSLAVAELFASFPVAVCLVRKE
jgi:(1->4)-alpha-D-glucan 1-alpha-D-glucosylmutase